MKTVICVLLALSYLGSIKCGCEKDNQPLKVSIIGDPKCKSSKSGIIIKDIPDTLSCVSYSYDKSLRKLSLYHINTGFNCCPGKLYCNIDMSGDTLMIKENESKVGCRCNCLYDLELQVTGVDEKVYQIKFIEPYAGQQEKIIFKADLINDPEGSFTVTRKKYPWGM